MRVHPSLPCPQGLLLTRGTLNAILAPPALRALTLYVPKYTDAALQSTITTWPQHLPHLTSLDLGDARLDAEATAALLFGMPSLTHLRCWSLSFPSRQWPVLRLRQLELNEVSLSLISDLNLGPQCRLGPQCSKHLSEDGLCVHQGGVEDAQMLTMAGRMLESKQIKVFVHGGSLGEEASAHMVRALAAGLLERGEGEGEEACSPATVLKLYGFTFRGSSTLALAELLQLLPRAEELDFW